MVLAVLTAPERRDFLEIVEYRHGRASTIVTSQLPAEHWHEAIGDPTLADAILDVWFITPTGSSSLVGYRYPHLNLEGSWEIVFAPMTAGYCSLCERQERENGTLRKT